jgi:hypothetical protein
MSGLSTQGAASVVDHYERLKISQDAPLEVIRASYRALAAKHHPDRHGQSSGSNTDMAALNAAYEVLCDPVSRAAYDAALAERKRTAPFGASAESHQAKARRQGGKAESADSVMHSTFKDGAEAGWDPLTSDKAPINLWFTRKRLIPMGGALFVVLLAAAFWWSKSKNEEQAAGRMLADQFKAANPNRDLAAEARALAEANLMLLRKDDIKQAQRVVTGPGASAPAPVPVPATTPAPAPAPAPAPPIRPVAPPLRHPLDGAPLSLKQVAALSAPLVTPAASQPSLTKP